MTPLKINHCLQLNFENKEGGKTQIPIILGLNSNMFTMFVNKVREVDIKKQNRTKKTLIFLNLNIGKIQEKHTQ